MKPVESSSPWAQIAPDALDRLTRTVYRYLRVIGCRPDQIDDLTQEAFVVAVEREHDFVWQGEAAAAGFLRRAARNLFLAQLRSAKARREVAYADDVWEQQCGDDGGNGYVAALRDCVSRLTDKQRQLVEGAYHDELGRNGLAEELGMKPDGIKTALRRIRALLRDCVDNKRSER